MNRKFHIKKGDLVQVNAGEDKGKQGKVLEVFPDKERGNQHDQQTYQTEC